MFAQPPPAAPDSAAARVLEFTPRRVSAANAFLLVWVVLWFAFNAAFVSQSLTDDAPGDPARGWELLAAIGFFAVWIALWGGGGILVVGMLAFQLFGRETAVVGGGNLVLRRRVGSLGTSTTYSLSEVRDVRTLRSDTDGHQVAFSYRGDTVRFGRRLDAAAADGLASALRTELPPQLPLAPPKRALGELRFTGSRLEIRNGLGRLGWTSRYERALIRNVRATPVVGEDGPSDTRFQVAFDYGGKTVTFGGGLTIGEAEALAAHVTEQLLVNAVADG